MHPKFDLTGPDLHSYAVVCDSSQSINDACFFCLFVVVVVFVLFFNNVTLAYEHVYIDSRRS